MRQSEAANVAQDDVVTRVPKCTQSQGVGYNITPKHLERDLPLNRVSIWALESARDAIFFRNFILLLCTAGLGFGYVQGYLMIYHRKTGLAVLNCIMIGLIPTFLNMWRAAKLADIGRMPLNALFVLGYFTGQLMGCNRYYLG